ncbi:uncharacterized protein LOC115744891 [Rhodamnia argentea]|uniref:Uncharacterized protein LOC115744891 n=1 Tax=Rhodamnia argentea TaxID=178133 RepID=A0A8B8PMY9_9MYRT|nr:uncharacterized protein LOC115744891 [Rhodamnia argentea]
MVSQESIDPPPSAPRISFSADFLDEGDFISINPDGHFHGQEAKAEEITTLELEKKPRNGEFEFLVAANVSPHKMMTADELFFEGKLLPFWEMEQSERLKWITLKPKSGDSEESRDQEPDRGEEEMRNKKNCRNSHNRDQDQEQNRASWFLDDDPSPRPPKCTVLWKELLRLRTKQSASSALSSSSSSSSTSSSSSSLGEAASVNERKEARDRDTDRESNTNYLQRIRKGMERTRSNSIRIRPMVNVPICKHVKSAGGGGGGSLRPLFPLKKGRVSEAERRGR